MKIPPALRIAVVGLVVTVVGATLTIAPSNAAEPLLPTPTITSAPAPVPVAEEEEAAPAERPSAAVQRSAGISLSATVSGLSASLSVDVEPSSALPDDDDDPTPVSTSQCGAGYMCIWSASNYTGSLQRFKTQSQFSTIYLSRVGSFFNNRPDRVFIYQYAGGSTSNCYAPRAKRSTTSGWLSSADSVYLSTASIC